MPKCKSCGADIEWIKTPAGKSHPVDSPPLKVWVKQHRFETSGRMILEWRLVEGFGSHFATCPNADKHRRKK